MKGWMKWLGMLAIVVGLIWASPGLRIHAQNVSQSLGNYVVPAGKTVHGNVTMNVGNVVVRGTVDGNVTVNVGNVVVYGVVTGNVNVGTGYIGGPGRIDGSRSVGIGSTNTAPIVNIGPWAQWRFPGVPGLGWLTDGFLSRFVARLAMNLVVSGILVTIFPAALRQVIGDIESNPVRAGATGCLSLVAWLVAMVGLAVIIIGIPLSILLAIAGVIAMLLANAAVVWLIGLRVERTAWPDRGVKPYVAIGIGGALLTVVELIPGIGAIIELIVV